MSTTSPPWPPPPAPLLAPLLDHDASSRPCATSTQPRRRWDGSLLLQPRRPRFAASRLCSRGPVWCDLTTVVLWVLLVVRVWWSGDGAVVAAAATSSTPVPVGRCTGATPTSTPSLLPPWLQLLKEMKNKKIGKVEDRRSR